MKQLVVLVLLVVALVGAPALAAAEHVNPIFVVSSTVVPLDTVLVSANLEITQTVFGATLYTLILEVRNPDGSTRLIRLDGRPN